MAPRMNTQSITSRLHALLLAAVLPGCLSTVAPDRSTLPFQEITSERLLAQLESPGWLVIDIRQSAAYNGWRLGKAARGGHIPGAESFALSWIRAGLDGLDALIEAKGIRPDLSIVVYGDDPDDCAEWARWLGERLPIPFDQLYIYRGGAAEWTRNPERLVEMLPRYERLVYPRWIHERSNPQTETEIHVVEVSWMGNDGYRREHIPGAIYLDTGDLESRPLWNVVSADRLRSALLAKGITRNTLVVVYGKDTTAAARAANLLLYAGVKDVRLLDGGFQAWLAAGLPIEDGEIEARPAADFGGAIPAHPEYLIGTAAAKGILSNPEARLISTRSWAEFVGETSGYSYIEAKGRIPGAIWGFANSGLGRVADYRNPNHTMRSAREIRQLWHRLGITSNQRLSFYCGTGWRASEVFFYAYVMGFPDISVYDGGWLEWSRDAENPIAVGDPARD